MDTLTNSMRYLLAGVDFGRRQGKPEVTLHEMLENATRREAPESTAASAHFVRRIANFKR